VRPKPSPEDPAFCGRGGDFAKEVRVIAFHRMDARTLKRLVVVDAFALLQDPEGNTIGILHAES
jgi:hypothetical protein